MWTRERGTHTQKPRWDVCGQWHKLMLCSLFSRDGFGIKRLKKRLQALGRKILFHRIGPTARPKDRTTEP